MNSKEVCYTSSFGLSKELQSGPEPSDLLLKVDGYQSTKLKMYSNGDQVGEWTAPSPITCLDATYDTTDTILVSSRKRKKKEWSLSTAARIVIGDKAGGLHMLKAKKLL